MSFVAALLLVLALFLGAGVTLTSALILSRRGRLDIERHVDLVVKPGQRLRSGGAVESWLTARAAKFDAYARRVFAVGAAHTWGMKTGAPRLLMIAAGSAAALWIATRGLGLTGWVATPMILFGAFLMPRLVLLQEQKKAERQFTDLLPDAIDTTVRMLRAGLPISSTVRFLGNTAPAPINGVFNTIADQVGIGVPVEDALDMTSARLALPDFRFFSVAVALQRATGGNLAATLEVLSDIVRKRRAVRLKARAASAEIRVSAYVLGVLPFLTIGGLLVIQPAYLTPLFADPRGHVILAVAGGGILLAVMTMRYMMRGVTDV